jgi:UDP-N-acetylglucosamine acyltransferase
MAIDPTACVASGARIADSVEIGPYCIVGPDVELQRGVRLLAHVYVT